MTDKREERREEENEGLPPLRARRLSRSQASPRVLYTSPRTPSTAPRLSSNTQQQSTDPPRPSTSPSTASCMPLKFMASKKEKEKKGDRAETSKRKRSFPENEYQIVWDEESYFKRFQDYIAKGKNLIPSRFIDIPSLKILEIYHPVRRMVSGIGLWNFLTNTVPSYKSITVEFFCTFKYNADKQGLQFYMHGTKHVYSRDEFRNLLHLPTGKSSEVAYGDDMTYELFFEMITGYPETIPSKKSSLIQHPAIRRSEDEVIDTPDVAHFVLDHLHRQVNNWRQNSQVSFGGIVTLLHKELYPNIELPNEDLIPGPITLDIARLVRCNYLQPRGPPYYHKGHSGSTTRMPIQVPFRFTDPAT